jgi:hypothetical protein
MRRTYSEFAFGESLRILKMAFPRYFQTCTLDVQSGETAALLTMLERGFIKCGAVGFQKSKKTAADVLTEAEQLAEILHKSSYTRALRNMVHAFSEYQYDLLRTRNGALYYPELKLYACVSYLTPKVLLKLLSEPDCEQVAVFTTMAKWGYKNHYLQFRRAGSWRDVNRITRNMDSL